MAEKVTVQTKHWSYTCGDGCCSDYGVDLYINDERVGTWIDDSSDAVIETLKHLGYDVEELETEWEGD